MQYCIDLRKIIEEYKNKYDGFCLKMAIKIAVWHIQYALKRFHKGSYNVGCNSWSRDVYEEYFNLPDFDQKYEKMLEGLDERSVVVLSRMVNRIQQFLRTNQEEFFVKYYKDEIADVNNINRNLYDFIEQVACGLYQYKGWLLPENSFEPCVFYHEHFIRELNNLEKVRKADIIDAGAYNGDSSLVLSQYTDGKVYAFEPVPVTYEKLEKTIVLNQQQGKIIPVSSGLGDEVVEIPMDANGGMGCSMLNKSDSGVLVNVTTLDKFVEENNIKVGLIKTDVEGFEQNLLRGAMKTIKEQKPALLISIYHNGSDLFDIKPMIESWNLGYKFKVRKSINGNITVDAMLICEVI